jgi:hypothetical protein
VRTRNVAEPIVRGWKMDLETEADGVVPSVTTADIDRLLADDREFGDLITLSAAEGVFLQAGEAQWVARNTDINGWEESYEASLAGWAKGGRPPPRYVLWFREPEEPAMRVATTVLVLTELRETFRQYLADDLAWQSGRSWVVIKE